VQAGAHREPTNENSNSENRVGEAKGGYSAERQSARYELYFEITSGGCKLERAHTFADALVGPRNIYSEPEGFGRLLMMLRSDEATRCISCNATDTTKQVFAMLSQLLALSTSTGSLPTTLEVRLQ
jgi:hypothetical protein